MNDRSFQDERLDEVFKQTLCRFNHELYEDDPFDLFGTKENDYSSFFVGIHPKEVKNANKDDGKSSPDTTADVELETPQITTSMSYMPEQFLPKINVIETQIRVPCTKKDGGSQIDDMMFMAVCKNQNMILHPVKDGFIPRKFWEKWPEPTFGWCIINFFQKKNNSNSRFLFKLYNALLIHKNYPELSKYVGVSFKTNELIKVEKRIFGRLIGVKTLDNSLFHQQGNFPSHGFEEVSAAEVSKICPGEVVINPSEERYLIHKDKVFVKGCTESQVVNYRRK